MIDIEVIHSGPDGGRLGNHMFRHLYALELTRCIGSERARVVGDGMPAWGITLPAPSSPTGRVCRLRGHWLPLQRLAALARLGRVDRFALTGWAQRLEYFGPPARYRSLFVCAGHFHAVAEEEILISVRAGEILWLKHPKYSVLPLSLLHGILGSERRNPVFHGQLQPGWYTDLLRAHFPKARFLPLSDPMTDFRTLYHARRLVLSLSSFAWMAAWLSPHAERIHYPMAGLFAPSARGNQLAPFDDRRYVFHAGSLYEGPREDERDYQGWVSEGGNFRPLTRLGTEAARRRAAGDALRRH